MVVIVIVVVVILAVAAVIVVVSLSILRFIFPGAITPLISYSALCSIDVIRGNSLSSHRERERERKSARSWGFLVFRSVSLTGEFYTSCFSRNAIAINLTFHVARHG